MIELERHIEILLLSNDCVIVPDLGGFMAHHVEARYDDGDGLFLPPLRTLGFNPQLRINDSLLAQSYVEAYDISYPEALTRIEHEVTELKQRLDNDGSYELNDIGVLYLNGEGNIQFEPCEAGILTPSLYGLSSFDFKPKTHTVGVAVKTVEQPVVAQPETAVKDEPVPLTTQVFDINKNEESTEEKAGEVEYLEDKTIKIKVSWLRNAVAIAAAIIAFFVLTTPVTNSRKGDIAIGNMHGNLLTKLMPKDTGTGTITIAPSDIKKAVGSADAKTETEADKTIKTEPQKAEDKKTKSDNSAAPKASLENSDGYCIVFASCIPKSNADRLAAELVSKGYKQTYTYVRNKVVRVVYGNFATEGEAYNELRNIRSNDDLSEAWVMKKK